MRKRRLVIAERRTLYRDALVAMCGNDGDIEIVGVAGDLDELRMIGRHAAPDVVVIAVEMVADGASAVVSLRTEWPKAFLVGVGEAARNDAEMDAHLPDTVSGVELLRLVRTANRCHVEYAEMPAGLRGAPGHPPPLTERELTIIELLADGLQNKEIARRLGIGAQTVKNHVARLLEKFGFIDRTQLAVFAVEHHLARSHSLTDSNA